MPFDSTTGVPGAFRIDNPRLAFTRFSIIPGAVIGFLRFVGLLNAAVWFGAALYQTFIAGPAFASREMADLLTGRNFPFFSVAIAQIVASRYFYLQLVCGFLALFHVLAEWLYLGKVPQRFWLGLLFTIVALNLAGGFLLQPKLKDWHRLAFAPNTPAETRKSAARAFRAWQGTAEVVNFLVAGGLGVYLWRMANPADTNRFARATKFRS
jgi:hypothetical protein